MFASMQWTAHVSSSIIPTLTCCGPTAIMRFRSVPENYPGPPNAKGFRRGSCGCRLYVFHATANSPHQVVSGLHEPVAVELLFSSLPATYICCLPDQANSFKPMVNSGMPFWLLWHNTSLNRLDMRVHRISRGTKCGKNHEHIADLYSCTIQPSVG